MVAMLLKEQLERLVKEVWNHGKLEVLQTVLDPHIVWHRPPYPDFRGLSAYRDYVAATRAAYPDVRLSVKQVLVDGDHMAMRWIFRGTHLGVSPTLGAVATGKKVAVTGCSIFYWAKGRFVEIWEHADWLTLHKQLGLIK